MPKPVFYRPRRRRRIVAGVAVAAGLLLLWVFVFTASHGGGSPDREPATATGERAEATPPLEHVHGLGVNPADARLYVATHSGLFRLSGHGEVRQVGLSHQDLMGFTVAGHDRFLASGHPDMAGTRAGQPGQLGLIESTDAGGTWELVSLAGEADLHALAYAGGRVYAIDALTGRFLVTDDLKDWATRGELPATSIAVDPANADRVVAATEGRLLQTLDAGRSWRDLPGPELVRVAWDARTGLWGVTGDGAAHVRDAETGGWSSLPRLPGAPQAILSDDGKRYAALHEEGRTAIYLSEGDGWQMLFDGR
jgi:hypothetical protein